MEMEQINLAMYFKIITM